jgi:alpha-L-arabinofuranosidase
MLHLLSGTRITENLPMTITEGGFGPAYFVAGRSDVTGAHIFKVANYNSTNSTSFTLSFDGVGGGATGNLTYLTAPMNASNPIGGNIVEEHQSQITASRNGTFSFTLPEYSVAVLSIAPEGPGYNYGNPGNRGGWKSFKDWGHGQKAWNEWGQYWS